MPKAMELSLPELRRELHKYPEAGWKEFRTTALVAEELDNRGYTLHLGTDALNTDERLGVPSDDEIQRARDRALDEGAPEKYLAEMGDTTGLVAEKTFGDGSGPVVGVRVDMDALEMTEASDPEHRPAVEGFASHHPNEMHACGHDGHTTIGIGIARALEAVNTVSGKLHLFFQPAEEGGRGGYPMSKTELISDVDYMLALHLGLGNETGKIIAGYDRPLSNSKVDVTFSGKPAHAGKAPNEGQNALHAATTAIQNLYGIPRHENGITRVNVGQVHSPNAQNVISDCAEMRVEVRGETAAINEYMSDSVHRIIRHAAGMHNVEYDLSLYGKTTSFTADDEIVSEVATAARSCDSVTTVVDRDQIGASEDASYLIKRVQATGGKGTYIGIGASNPSGHHTSTFDFDEEALDVGVEVVVQTLHRIMNAE
ncbi:amidohydrolase [Natrialba sp. SSL1]|uniref:amidohydrolase n=1 Tax=Natrialba sp. SSL1 TaxID=1869245 RepID=UPI0008F85862|nr:amidohydrolase [Natrialba sp. SSL1]OIB55283.1 N-acyl-L-amino acid amidohydrolase [Natrialba sp. SSL1]